jgi:hypothetical protein
MTRRIERAVALLRGGDRSVTEVCFAVGCSSLGTFSSRFTQLVGVPPSTYRHQAAQATIGMPSCVANRDQTGQESRSTGPRAAASLTAMDNTIHGSPTAMDITIHASFLPHIDPEASLVFWRDALGFGSAATSATAGCAGSRSALRTSLARPSSCSRRRRRAAASPRRSAARSSR